MYGLDTYDYGARGYYPASGRFMTVDPLCEMKPWQSPYMYCSGNPVNRTDPTGMVDGLPDQTIPEVTVTAPDPANYNSNSSSSVQFIDYVKRNTTQILRITPPTPSFNLSIFSNNESAKGNQTKPKNKEISDVLKQISAQLFALGISEASVEVIETSVKGVPTISVLFKGGASLANLASVASTLKGIAGPIGVALNLYVDIRKAGNNDESVFKAVVNTAVGVVGIFVPEIGIVYMILDHYGAFDGAPTNLPNYQPNSICPQDNTKTVIPNYTH